VQDRGRHHFIFDAPFEQASNPVDARVDLPAAEIAPDHRLAHDLQALGTEVGRTEIFVKLQQGSNRGLEVGHLAGRLAVFDVVGLGELQVGDDQFVDPKIDPVAGCIIDGAAVHQPFGDESLVERAALLGLVRTQVMVLASKRDHGLAGSLVQTVRGKLVFEFGHRRDSCLEPKRYVPFWLGRLSLTAQLRRVRKLR